MDERIASIDIGTNSLRLLVADMREGQLKRLHTKRRIVQLGKGLTAGGQLARDRMRLCVDVLVEYIKDCDRLGAQRILPVGTSAFRRARNAKNLVTNIKEQTGLDVVTLRGEEEGCLCLLGALEGLAKGVSRALITDIGGGSTELIWWTGYQQMPRILSLPLGMVHLTETFFTSDPPENLEIAGCEKAIADILDKQGKGTAACRSPEDLMIGTAGTLTTLAAMDQRLGAYDPKRIHGYRLGRKAIDKILREIRCRSRQQLAGRAGLELGRENVILAGTLIAKALMKHFEKGEFLISDWGLLEGIILRNHGNSKINRDSVFLHGA